MPQFSRFALMLAVGASMLSAGVVSVARTDLPVTFIVAEGDFLEIDLTAATLTIQGDSLLYKDAAQTVVDSLIRFVNVNGFGRIYFATDPATFGQLPPLPSPDFVNRVFLTADNFFEGSGPVIFPGGEVAGTYKCKVRVCQGSACSTLDNPFELELSEIPEPGTAWLIAGALGLAARKWHNRVHAHPGLSARSSPRRG